MMMTPEQYAELQAKAQPLMELLVEVLNELNSLDENQRVVANNNEILTPGGTVFLHSWTGKWQIGTQR